MSLNVPVPDFSLFDTFGTLHRLGDYRGKVVILNFWSAECPWSERADKSLLALISRLGDRAALLSIASNLNETVELINVASREHGLPFVLRDEGCVLAVALNAETTPHVFVVDEAGILRYRGAVDDVTFRTRTPLRFYVEEALTAILEGHLPALQETPAYGCTIVRCE